MSRRPPPRSASRESFDHASSRRLQVSLVPARVKLRSRGDTFSAPTDLPRIISMRFTSSCPEELRRARGSHRDALRTGRTSTGLTQAGSAQVDFIRGGYRGQQGRPAHTCRPQKPVEPCVLIAMRSEHSAISFWPLKRSANVRIARDMQGGRNPLEAVHQTQETDQVSTCHLCHFWCFF